MGLHPHLALSIHAYRSMNAKRFRIIANEILASNPYIVPYYAQNIKNQYIIL